MVSTISHDIRPGVLLISHPLAAQHNKRSVILLLQHDKSGSQGIIINHRSEQFLLPAVENFPSTFMHYKNTLNFGGTVARLTCVHTCEKLGGEAVPYSRSPLFHGIEPSLISKLPSLTQEEIGCIHFYFGSCVWAPFELQKQIDSGFWLPIETTNDTFFDLNNVMNGERNSFKFRMSDAVAFDHSLSCEKHEYSLNTDGESTTKATGMVLVPVSISCY